MNSPRSANVRLKLQVLINLFSSDLIGELPRRGLNALCDFLESSCTLPKKAEVKIVEQMRHKFALDENNEDEKSPRTPKKDMLDFLSEVKREEDENEAEPVEARRPKSAKKTRRLRATRRQILPILESYQSAAPQESPQFQQRLQELQTLFKLEDKDAEILSLFLLLNLARPLRQCLERLLGIDLDDLERESKHELLHIYNTLAGLPDGSIQARLRSDSPLIRCSLIDTDDFSLPEGIRNHLGSLGNSGICEQYFQPCTPPELPLSSFTTQEEELAILLPLLQAQQPERPFHLLVHGPPGTGKSQFCLALAQALGRRALQLNSEAQTNAKSPERFFFLATELYSLAASRDAVLVLDDAEALLDSRPNFLSSNSYGNTRKARFNHFMERSPGLYLWNVNDLSDIPDFVQRRFDYSLAFRQPSTKSRVELWQRVLAAKKLDALYSGDELCALVRVQPHSIALVERAAANAALVEESSRRRTFEATLAASAKLFQFPRQRAEAATRFDPSLLNCTGTLPVLSLLDKIPTVLARIRSGQFPGANFNLLFAGPPGTGKTELVRELARRDDLELITLRGSDLADKYVGETEKKIRAAFDEAEARQAILFFDEADSILIDRAEVKNSYEQRWVNEFLCGMENFRGVFIAATNHIPKLDNALLRRFSVKLNFDYLDTTAKLKLYQACLAPLCPLPFTDSDAARLAAIPKLAAGDFKAVLTALLLEEELSHAQILDALARECAADRSRNSRPSIGFAG